MINYKEIYSHSETEIKQFTDKELMQACYEAMEIQNGHYYRMLKDEKNKRNGDE